MVNLDQYSKLVNSTEKYMVQLDTIIGDMLNIDMRATELQMSKDQYNDMIILTSLFFLHCQGGYHYEFKNGKFYLSLAGLTHYLEMIKNKNIISVKDVANDILKQVLLQQGMQALSIYNETKKKAEALGIDLNF